MSYQIIESPVVSAQTVLGVDLSFTYTGIFKPLYSPLKQASANFRNLLQTQRGERYYHPSFGCDLIAILFEPNVNELKGEISAIITEATAEWLPYIDIDDISITTNEDDPLLEHQLVISITISSNTIQTEKIVIFVGENGNISIQ
jgi:phage baseplate assembly protein W